MFHLLSSELKRGLILTLAIAVLYVLCSTYFPDQRAFVVIRILFLGVFFLRIWGFARDLYGRNNSLLAHVPLSGEKIIGAGLLAFLLPFAAFMALALVVHKVSRPGLLLSLIPGILLQAIFLWFVLVFLLSLFFVLRYKRGRARIGHLVLFVFALIAVALLLDLIPATTYYAYSPVLLPEAFRLEKLIPGNNASTLFWAIAYVEKDVLGIYLIPAAIFLVGSLLLFAWLSHHIEHRMEWL